LVVLLDRDKLFEDLKRWISQLPSVTQAAHRFGGTEFQVDGLEFMHSHGPSFLDIRLSMKDQAGALKDGKAMPHRFAPQAGWVSFRIENAEDLGPAKELIQAAYENAKASMDAHEARRKSKPD
jgi:deferrochelatase/peroxidase EfeB